MRTLWRFLRQERSRHLLSWLGGGFAALAIGAWAIFIYLFPPDKGGDTQPAVTIESGVTAGRDINARDITIEGSPEKSRP